MGIPVQLLASYLEVVVSIQFDTGPTVLVKVSNDMPNLGSPLCVSDLRACVPVLSVVAKAL